MEASAPVQTEKVKQYNYSQRVTPSIEAMKSGRVIPVEVYSDVMAPEYQPMDIVLVDSEHTNPIGGGVFALDMRKHGGIGYNVVRCENHGTIGISLLFDNKNSYEAIHQHGDLMPIEKFKDCVIGRVVGSIKARMLNREPLRI